MGCSGCLVGCGCLGGLTIGTFIGKRLGEQRRPPAQRKPADSVQVTSGGSRHDLLDLQTGFTNHDSTAPFNATLELWWPHLKSAIENVLRKEVEPKLQKALPGLLKGLSFSTVNLGQEERCPLNIVKVQPLLDERTSVEHGRLRCVRLVLGVDLESEVCVVLQLKVLKAGASFVKIRGSIVVEFYNLMDTFPVYNGLRIYFSDKPDLDLTMFGGVGSILNIGFLKSILMKVILTELSQIFVLPHRLVVPPPPKDNATESECVRQDTIMVKAPRPAGMLRLVIEAVEGLHGVLPRKDTPWFVGLDVGTHSCRTATRFGAENGGVFDKDNVFDFIVHDSESQHVKFTLRPQSHSVLWGYYPGEPLRACFFRISDFISHGVSKSVLMRDPQQGRSTSLLSRRITSEFECTDFNDNTSNSVKVSIKAEWGKLSRNEEQAIALTFCSSLYSGWERPHFLDAVAVVLVGIQQARDLNEVQASYWCVTSVTHVAAGEFITSGKNGSIMLTSKKEKARRCATDQQICICGNVLLADSIVCRKCGRKREIDVLEPSEIQVIWDTAYFVPLYDPCHARVEIKVFSDFGNVGTVQHDVLPLLRRSGLKEDYDDALLPAQYPEQDENSCMMKSILSTRLRVWVLEAGEKCHGLPQDVRSHDVTHMGARPDHTRPEDAVDNDEETLEAWSSLLLHA